MSALTWAGVALLGGAGAVARFVVDGAVAGRVDRELPVGTLAVNVSGAFLLGLVAGLALAGDALLLVGTATLGSYTTFSTWMLETQRLVEDGEARPAAANIVLSLAAGIAAVAIGRALA
jgi:fluoride exporter